MKIKEVLLTATAWNTAQFPKDYLPEIVFAGRSNVGKSTLLNAIINIKNLAKISSRPGKTVSINFFKVNNQFYFVDIPGYGYASRPADMRSNWQAMLEGYFENRDNIRCVLLLLDVRQTTDQDLQMRNWLLSKGLDIIFVITKSDKLPFSRRLAAKKELIEKFSINTEIEPVILFSSLTKEGKEELFSRIGRYLAS